MNVLILLIPVSLFLGLLGLAAFMWSVRDRQYDDPEGEAHRVLDSRYDDSPAPGGRGGGTPQGKRRSRKRDSTRA